MLKTVNEAGKHLSLKLENEYLHFVIFLVSKHVILLLFFFNMLVFGVLQISFLIMNSLSQNWSTIRNISFHIFLKCLMVK